MDRSPKTPDARKRQLAGKHKGLLHAVRKRKADNSANYASNFDHGQTAFDFERSAQAAGESRQEVRDHLALVDRTLLMLCGFFGLVAAALPKLPLHSDAASPRAPKLVRALALLLWRPLRLFCTQEHWEWLALCYRLQQLVRWRQQHGDLTVARFEDFHEHVEAIVQNYDSATDWRLKRIEKRFWKVWKLYRSLVGVVTTIFGGESRQPQASNVDSAVENTSEIRSHEDASEISNLESSASPECIPGISNSQNASEISNPESEIALDERAPAAAHHPLSPGSPEPAAATRSCSVDEDESAERPSRAHNDPEVSGGNGTGDAPGSQAHDNDKMAAGRRTTVGYPAATPLVQQRGTPHYDQFHPTWLERLDDLTPEAIADCFQSPSHNLKAQGKRAQPPAVKDPNQWQKHPSKPHLPEVESTHLPATDLIRNPSERVLRRLVRTGELTVPGSFEDFAALVEAALGQGKQGSGSGGQGSATQAGGTRDSGSGRRDPGTQAKESAADGVDRVQIENQKSKIENDKSGCGNKVQIENRKSQITNFPTPDPRTLTPDPLTHALAESLWNRVHVFSAKVAELRDLLEATLVWDANRFLPLWLKLLPVEYAYDAVASFKLAHGPDAADFAWGDDEDSLPRRRRRAKPQPFIAPRTEAEGRQKQAGELQRALRIWFVAVWYVLLPVILSSHKVTVAFYEWAVSRFGIREGFLKWRPKLSLAQLDTRRGRPEWAVRVVTVTGKTLVKLNDGRIFEPEK